jgi:SSS family transporter
MQSPALLAFFTPPTPSAHLHPIDLLLIVAYLIGITLFGLRFREKKAAPGAPAQSLQSYFLANNTIPWWAIALSIVSAETSTLTIISIPGVAFAGDFGFLQVVLGYMIGRIVVAAIFLPKYFRGQMLTAYQLIDQRFGSTLHKVTAGLFLLTRAAAEGVRVFAVSIVVGIAIGTNDILSIALITLLTLLYTFEGGMAAVIWTDVVQMAIYVGGTIIALVTLGNHVDGGWQTIHTVASAAGKFHMFNFALNLTQNYTFWAGVLGGTFLTMASHGTDQLMVQRMLAARNLRESRLALLSSGVVIFIQFAFFLLIGAGLYVFYSLRPTPFAGGPAGPIAPDRIFPLFIVHEMPTGIAGLLVAAILAAAMSNLSAALNSLSSTTVVDFYLHFRKPKSYTQVRAPHLRDGLIVDKVGEAPRPQEVSPRERNLVAKLSTVFWAVILFAVAAYSVKAGGKGHVVETGLSIASVAYGALLGVFLLGTLTRYATQTGAILGMIVGFAFNLFLWLQPHPLVIAGVTLPKVAFTWYVLLGSAVTFAVGSLFSLLFRKQSHSRRKPAIVATAVALAFLSVIPEGNPGLYAQTLQIYDFTPVSALIQASIDAHKLPGAVLVIGHSGQVVFHHAYGDRKLAGEPGPDGELTAEPMTEDTVFDMASLSKCLSTATAVMQLYEQGKLQFDDPIQKYLPAYNPANDPERAKVTIRMLLTHYSGEAPDVSLKDPWGLAAPDKAEGIRRALATPLKSTPGETFVYSDINFILLGDLVETLSGQTLDVYAREHIFEPLGMTDTHYLPLGNICGDATPFIRGAAVVLPPIEQRKTQNAFYSCATGRWVPAFEVGRTAPTAHDDESKADPSLNPDYDHLLRATVHDPTTRRMGGVAGHAGVFSTGHDVALYAQALLDRLAGRPSNFPLKQSTLMLMTTPEQPKTAQSGATIFTENGQPTKGIAARGFGWDINTAFSRPRGQIFPIGSFGHTGFTGTTLWMDPGSDTYVVFLTNAVHPRGGFPVTPLRGAVATATAKALHLYESTSAAIPMPVPPATHPKALTGIDVLEQSNFAALQQAATRHQNHLNLGILTNVAGVDSQNHRTIDVIATQATKDVPQLHLTTLFAAEHGLSAKQETTAIAAEFDQATNLPITSLYGPKPSDRRPTHAQLANLDAVLIDLQDVGNRFWTFDTAMGYFLEASAAEQRDYHHDLEIIVLDHPDPSSGTDFAVQGPSSDPGRQSYVDYTPLPARHGMTIGELARYFNAEATPTAAPAQIFADAANSPPPAVRKGIGAHLTVVPLQNWTRNEFLDQTGIPWVPPSPNLRSLNAAILYPGIGLFETTNLSVGRGTDTPFEHFGAPYLKPADLLACLTPRQIPGIQFTPTTLSIIETPDHYPYHGQTIPGLNLTITDRTRLNPPELAIEIMTCVHTLYPTQFNLDRSLRLLANADTLARLQRSEDPHAIAASWQPSLDEFRKRRAPYLLYPDSAPASAH